VYVSGCPPVSRAATDGNFNTLGNDYQTEHDYFFYIFTQEKESNSPFVYLLYRYDSDDKIFV